MNCVFCYAFMLGRGTSGKASGEWGDLFQLRPLERLNLVLEVDESARDLMHLMKKKVFKRVLRACDLIRMPETFFYMERFFNSGFLSPSKG